MTNYKIITLQGGETAQIELASVSCTKLTCFVLNNGIVDVAYGDIGLCLLPSGQSVFEFTGKIGYPDIAEFVLRNNTPDQTVYVSVGYELIPDYPINSEYFYEV